MQFSSGIASLSVWALSGVSRTFTLTLWCYCSSPTLSGVCPGMPQNRSARMGAIPPTLL